MLTKEWLAETLARNPALSISIQGGAAKKDGAPVPDVCSHLKPLDNEQSKYLNRKVYIYENGKASTEKMPELGKALVTFDSIKEYNRARDLELMQKAGQISQLRRQIPLHIQDAFTYDGSKIRAITYVADFAYTDSNGDYVVEDVKPFDEKRKKYRLTQAFQLKWKLVMYRYPNYKFKIF